jgi:death-on-curing family protein
LALVVAINREVRHRDEWFDEPDDLGRVQSALDRAAQQEDVVEASATLAYRLVRTQGFGEGNKRTAVLTALWMLERNGVDGQAIVPPDDLELAGLLVAAAAGRDVEGEVTELFKRRSQQ